MADLVMGAMGSIIPKLRELLKEEYSLQTGVKERISSLTKELEVAQAALRKVAEVPWDQLDEQVWLWAREVRESSYDMEDVLDIFLVRVHGPDSAEQESLLKRLKKMTNLWKKSKARRKISIDVEDIMSHLQAVTERCCRYKVHDIVTRPATTSTIDPRLHAMYNKVKNLVGIDNSSRELISKLQSPRRDDVSNPKMKVISVSGTGGLGKTTLAKVVYDKLIGDYDCGAFVPVGRNPDLKKVLKDILIDLDQIRYLDFSTASLNERQLINELHSFLTNKRYFIVIDDVWEIESWETIKLAIDVDNSCGGRIIITTRKLEVATKTDEYKLQPLPYDSSRKLFFTRVSGHEGKDVDNDPDEVSDKFIRKCHGIPLAIITMASLLADKQRIEWFKLYKTFDFGYKENKEAENTMRILSFSFYDLPSHLRTCLLYLSAYPEDCIIPKDSLVWKWVAEGFVQEKQGIRLFEIAEGYFNDLINRSMIQAVESDYDENIIIGCRVHDMVLDFIRSMSREENFFIVLDNVQGTLPRSNVRRIAHHNGTLGHTHQVNHFDMSKVRSFVAMECVIETWVPLSTFKLLRVLVIENERRSDRLVSPIEHVVHLLHLRFLSLKAARIGKVPEKIGALRFLQMLDLSKADILELPSSRSWPKQLVCLRIKFGDDSSTNPAAFPVEGLTSLEELSVTVNLPCATRRSLMKGLNSLRELRVLNANIFCDEDSEINLVQSLCHLEKIEHLNIEGYLTASCWQEIVLPRHLGHLALSFRFCKLPSSINPSCLPCLSHLGLDMKYMDEQDLKILGRLPELRFLKLTLWCSATISNISGAAYFPKLRCLNLPWSMVLFVGNKEDESVSFHMWDGEDDIAMPSVSDDELQRPMPSVCSGEMDRPLERRSKLQHGIIALAYYLLAFFQLVLSFLKKWSLQKVGKHPVIYNRGSAPAANGEDEDPIAMPSVSDGENRGTVCSKGTETPCFMPGLQVLYVRVRGRATQDNRYCDNLGWEYLSSLREINMNLYSWDDDSREKVEAQLRRAAEVHHNRPTLRMKC